MNVMIFWLPNKLLNIAWNFLNGLFYHLQTLKKPENYYKGRLVKSVIIDSCEIYLKSRSNISKFRIKIRIFEQNYSDKRLWYTSWSQICKLYTSVMATFLTVTISHTLKDYPHYLLYYDLEMGPDPTRPELTFDPQ